MSDSNVIRLNVAHDHVATLTRLKKPVRAVEELIWNGLDADADEVTVRFARNALQGIEAITISDNGSGIDPADREIAFGFLGGSPKKDKSRTPGGRVLHGKEGQGRFRAFALGERVDWKTRYRDREGQTREWSISSTASDLCEFTIGTATPVDGKTGTVVQITKLDDRQPSLTTDSVREDLLIHLALYLRSYPKVRVIYDGVHLKVDELIQHTAEYEIDAVVEGRSLIGKLLVIEWNREMDRKLYLCTRDGFTRHELPLIIHAKGFSFTAYLKSEIIENLDDSQLDIAEMFPQVRVLVDASKDRVREHFKAREADRIRAIVDEWKSEGVYPYSDDAKDPLGRAEREVFDLCAISVQERMPSFDGIERDAKRLTMRLLRQALETNPSSLQAILREVINLTQQQQDDFARLLQRTRLAAIIQAANLVADRLTFIASLEQLLVRQAVQGASEGAFPTPAHPCARAVGFR